MISVSVSFDSSKQEDYNRPIDSKRYGRKARIIWLQETLTRVDWKCNTWKWRTIKIARHEIAGHERLDYFLCAQAGDLKAQSALIFHSPRIEARIGIKGYSVYSDSDVCRFWASFLLCLCMSCNFMSCIFSAPVNLSLQDEFYQLTHFEVVGQ